MHEELKPKPHEIKAWLVSTLKHSCHVEYFLHQLDLGEHDPERPHDIYGQGNKFTWLVMRGMAIQYRSKKKPVFEQYVLPSLEMHRHQYHHRKWNEPNHEATAHDMRVGAVDAICSLLQHRKYQGGSHTYEQIEKKIETNLPHAKPWMKEMLDEMRQLEQPDIKQIKNLKEVPNIGIDDKMYERTLAICEVTLENLKRFKGYELW